MPVRTLCKGNVGPDVKAVQQALNTWSANPALDPDGKFGDATDKAVREFQHTHRLKPDGVVGKKTRRVLFPIGVSTITLVGSRLGKSKGWTNPFHLPSLTLNPLPGLIRRSLFEPVKFPGLPTPLPAPGIPDLTSAIPPAPGGGSSSLPFGFVFDHVELQPGAQTTFPLGGARQDMFVLTMQNVYRRGPDDGAHTEADLGVQMGRPLTDPNGPWTVNPFIQLTDVDRFGALGSFHYWQPYAQAGYQFMGLGNPRPALTASLVPLNLGWDANNWITVNAASGLALALDLETGRVQAGAQFSVGLTVKLGVPNTPLH